MGVIDRWRTWGRLGQFLSGMAAVLTLMAVVVGAAIAFDRGQQERGQLPARVERLEAEVPQIHRRLDAGDGRFRYDACSRYGEQAVVCEQFLQPDDREFVRQFRNRRQ